MNIRVTFIYEDGREYDEMFCRFSTIKQARRELRKQFPKRKLIWLERCEGKEHDWEQIDKEGRFFGCKNCAMQGVKDGNTIRPLNRVHYNSILHCEPSRLLANHQLSIKWAAQVRNSGFREGQFYKEK
jgi:hypothetical protein